MKTGVIESFSNDKSTVYWGEALQALDEKVQDASIDLIFADPPYNIGKQFGQFHDRWASEEDYAAWCYHWLEICLRKLKRSGSIYVMTSTQAMPNLDLYLRSRVRILSRIVWHYDSSGTQAKRYYGSLYEPILFCVKNPERYTFNIDDIKVEAKTGSRRKLIDYRKPIPTQYNTTKIPGNVWSFPRVRYRMNEYEEHPSQKPEALMERIIRASSNPGDVVLDPFAGTFTTCAVAQRLGRSSIGIEREGQYVAIGLRRLGISNEFQGKVIAPPAKNFTRRRQSVTPSLFETV
jgi:adenine-specific DNA-methyltransferase